MILDGKHLGSMDPTTGEMYKKAEKGKIVVNIFCCEDMRNNVFCVDEREAFNNGCIEDKVLYYSSKFDEYGIPVYGGYNHTASSYIQINHCPWCGKTLPISRRDEWIETLEKLGYDVPFDESIPQKFKTSEWYNKKQDNHSPVSN